jgi:hypothetical protein
MRCKGATAQRKYFDQSKDKPESSGAISSYAFCDGGRTLLFSLVPGQRERHREIS